MDNPRMEKVRNLLASAPKPQLHLHLDGSLSYNFIRKTIQQIKSTNPIRFQELKFFNNDTFPGSKEALFDWLMGIKASELSKDSFVGTNSNWKVFDFCNQFLQAAEELHAATMTLVFSLHDEHGVNYMEIRFAPVLHTLLNLQEIDAVQAVVNGFNDAKMQLASKGHTIDGGIILCALRSYPVEKADETLQLVKKFKGSGVLGFDIAGDEGQYPLDNFKNVLVSAKTSGINITVHAGEWDERKHPSVLQNLKLALDLSVDRIGHGLALRSVSEEMLLAYRQAKISVEVCLTANCGNPNKCKSFSDHPISTMLKNDILVSAFNCDNLLLSGNRAIGAPDPTNECVRALLDCQLTPAELLQVIENGYQAGFQENSNSIGKASLKIWEEVYIPKLLELLSKN